MNCIVGAVDNYDFSKIRNWLKSIVACGYTDEVILIAYRIDEATVASCKAVLPSLQIYQVDYDANGQPLAYEARGKNTQVHQYRFFHFYTILRQINKEYDYVIMTDVKDCIFQLNPFRFIHDKLTDVNKDLIAPSEFMEYKNELWGNNNLLEGYGPYIQNIFKDTEICNVGTIAGTGEIIKNMALILYLMGQYRSLPNDQCTYNILVHTLLRDRTLFTDDYMPFACELGTTNDPAKSHYISKLLHPQPQIDYSTGLVYNSEGKLYFLVHQWDRIPELNSIINQRYS